MAYKNKNNGNDQAKRSGAVYSTITKGKHQGGRIVNAWNKSKSRGLLTATVAPYKSSKKYKSKSGNTYVTMIAKIFYHNTGMEIIEPCSMNIETEVVVLRKIGMVITPNGSGTTKSGKRVKGYFGTFQN